MSDEIELKFEINDVDIAPLDVFLTQWAMSDAAEHALPSFDSVDTKTNPLVKSPSPIHQLKLSNCYYDTAGYYLRNHGCGLRVRGTQSNGVHCYEITVKRSGTTIVGLHERAEFNVDLPNAKLNLSVLPHAAFPKQCDIAQLQQQLVPLFETNFDRKTWLIWFANSQIEVALDQGYITSNGRTKIIQEVELEIKQGNTTDLLNFAMELSRFHLHLFSQSKAARGYRLLQNRSLTTMSVEHVHTMSDLLQFWQQNEEYALDNHDLPFYLQTLTQIKNKLAILSPAILSDQVLKATFIKWCAEFPVITSVKAFAYSDNNTLLKLLLIKILSEK